MYDNLFSALLKMADDSTQLRLTDDSAFYSLSQHHTHVDNSKQAAVNSSASGSETPIVFIVQSVPRPRV